MMDYEKTGGPAFPFDQMQQGAGDIYDQFAGMSIRDFAAFQALPAAMAAVWRDLDYTPKDGLNTIENTARLSYQIADAMLAARKA